MSSAQRFLVRAAAAGVVAFLTLSLAAQAQTHCVPSSFSGSCNDSHATIQDALDDAVNGDTVLVAAGTYAENLTVDVDVTLQGAQAGVDARGRVAGAPSPATESIIAPASGTGLTLVTGSAGTTIDGFAFSGGTRAIESGSGPITNLLVQNNHIDGFTGNGVFLNDLGTDVTVARNVIDGSSKTGGGGLFHLDTDAFDGFQFDDNIVRDGATATGFFVDGNHNVGVSVARAPRIVRNLIVGNVTGMNLGTRAFEFGNIENNTFQNSTFDGLQGGIQNTTVQHNIFQNNGRSGLALTSFGNLGVDRGAQNLTATCNGFISNDVEAVFFSSGQAVGTILTNHVETNSIFANVAGATYNGTESPIDVESNWWGSATGPTAAANPGGTGDSLIGTGSANFDFTPFLIAAPDCVLDMALAKIASDTTPQEGQSVTFTITLTNAGGPRDGVVVNDLLPAGVTFVSATPSQGSYDSGTGVWDVGFLGVPVSATLTIVATVDAGTAGTTITNTATIAGAAPVDATAGDDSAAVALVVAQPDLSIDKSGPAVASPGQTLTFTITVINAGGGDATSVTVTDVLPAGLTFVSADASQGSYDSGTGVWAVGALAAGGGTATLDIVAIVGSVLPGTTITNNAAITASTPPDATPGDNADSAAVLVIAVVPALSPVGLLALFTLLAGAGLIALRRI